MFYSAVQLKATATAVPALRATALVVRSSSVVATIKLMAQATADVLAMAATAPALAIGIQAQLLKASAITGYFLKFVERMDEAALTDATAFRMQRMLDELAEIADEARITTGKGLADGSALTDANLVRVIKGLEDLVGISDSIVMAFNRVMDEPVVIGDVAGKRLRTGRADAFMVDEGPGFDPYSLTYFAEDYAQSGRPQIKVIKGFSDVAGNFTDVVNKKDFGKGVNDPVALTETMARHLRRYLTDAISATDDIDGNLTTEDDQTMQYRKAVSDVFAVTDTMFYVTAWVRTPNDAAALTDAAVSRLSKPLAEPVNLTDPSTLRVAKVLSDGYTINELAAKASAKPLTDAAAVTDTALRLTNKSLADAAAFVDASRANMTKVLTDSAGVSENKLFALSKPLSDSGAATDAAAKSFNSAKADSASITDAGAVRMQSYCDITYFAQDYVGTTFTF